MTRVAIANKQRISVQSSTTSRPRGEGLNLRSIAIIQDQVCYPTERDFTHCHIQDEPPTTALHNVRHHHTGLGPRTVRTLLRSSVEASVEDRDGATQRNGGNPLPEHRAVPHRGGVDVHHLRVIKGSKVPHDVAALRGLTEPHEPQRRSPGREHRRRQEPHRHEG